MSLEIDRSSSDQSPEVPQKSDKRSSLSNVLWTASLLAGLSMPGFDRSSVEASENVPQPVPQSVARPAPNLDTLEQKNEAKVAHDFKLKDLSGEQISLSETLKKNEGKVILLKFGASWCGPCRASTEQLKELHGKYPEKLVILDVNFLESEETAKRYAQQHQTKYKTLLDSDGAVSQKYGVSGLPTFALVKVVESNPVIVWTTSGYNADPNARKQFEASITQHFHK
jgi:thiol-disulfide isomerase/thioredoxin